MRMASVLHPKANFKRVERLLAVCQKRVMMYVLPTDAQQGARSRRRTIVPMLLIMLGFLHPAHAADFTCTGGDVACLIAAINTANVNGQANTITLAAGTYNLTAVDNTTDGPNGLPSITSSLAIVGAGAASTGIIRQQGVFRLIHVAANGSLTLQGVSVQRGNAGPGCAIFNNGRITVISSTVANNGDTQGGGILNRGIATITDSVVSGNFVEVGLGGGISNSGSLQITRSRITGNNANLVGGGIYTSGPTIITDSAIVGNTTSDSAGSGAGIYIFTGGNLLIERSTVSGNDAQLRGGGIVNFGTLTVKNSAFLDNIARGSLGGGGGGAIRNEFGSVFITSSTFARNREGGNLGGGGAIHNDAGMVQITNSTFADNTSTCGGAIYSRSGSGISVLLQNTILALNQANPAAANPLLCGNITVGSDDCFGPVTSLDNNLIGNPTGCTVTLGSNDLTGDPGLDRFSDNGTPGNGHFPLLSTSRAIDAGNDAACPPTDQLGQPRAGQCDIGAIEFQALRVMIDIKPGDDPPSINPRSNRVIPVAILTTSTFNAATVDAATVRFGKTGSEAAPVRATLEDVDRNGTLDMILHFHTQDTGITCGDTSASLTGKTLSKVAFRGSDALRTVGCH